MEKMSQEALVDMFKNSTYKEIEKHFYEVLSNTRLGEYLNTGHNLFGFNAENWGTKAICFFGAFIINEPIRDKKTRKKIEKDIVSYEYFSTRRSEIYDSIVHSIKLGCHLKFVSECKKVLRQFQRAYKVPSEYFTFLLYLLNRLEFTFIFFDFLKENFGDVSYKIDRYLFVEFALWNKKVKVYLDDIIPSRNRSITVELGKVNRYPGENSAVLINYNSDRETGKTMEKIDIKKFQATVDAATLNNIYLTTNASYEEQGEKELIPPTPDEISASNWWERVNFEGTLLSLVYKAKRKEGSGNDSTTFSILRSNSSYIFGGKERIVVSDNLEQFIEEMTTKFCLKYNAIKCEGSRITLYTPSN